MGKYKSGSIAVAKGTQLDVHRGNKKPSVDAARNRQAKPVDFAHVPFGHAVSGFGVVDHRGRLLVSDTKAKGRAIHHAAGVQLHGLKPEPAQPVQASLIIHRIAVDPAMARVASGNVEPLFVRAVTQGVVHAVVPTPAVVSVAALNPSVTEVPETDLEESSTFEQLMAGVSPEDIAATEILLSPAGWQVAESTIIAAVMGPVAAVASSVKEAEDPIACLVAPDYPAPVVASEPLAIRHFDGTLKSVKEIVSGRVLPTRTPVFAVAIPDVEDFVTTPAAEHSAAYEEAIAAVFGPADAASPVKTELSSKAALKTIGGQINFLAGWTMDRTAVMTWLKSEAIKPFLTKLGLTPGGLVQKLFAKSPDLSSLVVKLLVDLRSGRISLADFHTAVDNLSEDDFKVKRADLSGGMSGGKGQNPQREQAQAEAGA